MTTKRNQPKIKATPRETVNRRVRILVSSVVLGYEDFLESIYSLLEDFGYEVLMSHKGTIRIDPDISAMSSCLEEVEKCDVFLGIVLPRYGSGVEEVGEYSITHLEAIKAIKLNKPRWFLVHEHVAIARQLLKPYRAVEEIEPGKFKAVEPWKLKPGIDFKGTAILSDLRVLDLYELAMRHDIPKVKDRKGNWVQVFGPEEDARLFATAQFRRYKEVEKKYLPRIANPKSTSAKGQKK
jgi:hypothetical protein